MPLIATPGSPVANSYCTVAEAGLILSERLHTSAWDNATTLDREKSLMWATRLIDDLAHWSLRPTAPLTQALWWPVVGALDVYGNPILSTVIPGFLKRATAEYALALLEWESAHPHSMASAASTATRIRAGSFEVSLGSSTSSNSSSSSPYDTMPPSVRRLLGLYGLPIGGAMARVLRV